MKVAAPLLHSIGVSTPERFLRLSVREVVGNLLELAGPCLHKTPDKQLAIEEAANLIVTAARAEKAARRALQAQNAFKEVQRASQAEVRTERSDDEAEVEGAETDIAALVLSKHEKLRRSEEYKRWKKTATSLFETFFSMLQGVEVEAASAKALTDRGLAAEPSSASSPAEPKVIKSGRGLEPRRQASFRYADRKTLAALFKSWKSRASALADFRARADDKLLSRMLLAWTNGLTDRVSSARAMLEKFKLRNCFSAWQKLRKESDEGEETGPAREAPTDSRQLDSVLHMLEAAIVETHQKHSQLLRLTDMERLFERISAHACHSLQSAGICDAEALWRRGLEEGAFSDEKFVSELRRLGVEPPDVETMLGHLKEEGEHAAPQPYEEKRDRMLQEMAALRVKLEHKQKLLAGADVSQEQGGDVEIAETTLKNVMADLLQALGASAALLSMKEDGLGEEMAEDAGRGGGEEEEEEEEEGGFTWSEGQLARNRDTRRYIKDLREEDQANRAVLQVLNARYPPDSGNETERDADAQEMRKRLEESQSSLEQMMEQYQRAMLRARTMLQDDSPADLPSSSLSATKTQAELEAAKLAEDMRERKRQAEYLEQENVLLREHIRSLRHGFPGAKRSDGAASHWSADLADPELAHKYREYADSNGEEARSRQEEAPRWRDAGEGGESRYAWELKTEANTLCSRSSVFEEMLEHKISGSRREVEKRLQEVRDKLKDVEEGLGEVEHQLGTYEKPESRSERNQIKIGLDDPHMSRLEMRKRRLLDQKDQIQRTIADLEREYDAADLRKELASIEESRDSEVHAVKEEIESLRKFDVQLEDPETSERIAELQDKAKRIQDAWDLKLHLRRKEIEIELLEEKRRQDEELLRKEIEEVQTSHQVCRIVGGGWSDLTVAAHGGGGAGRAFELPEGDGSVGKADSEGPMPP
eukprot:754403-Hanusia_phi.AAC.3